jgi:hypothetical protein
MRAANDLEFIELKSEDSASVFLLENVGHKHKDSLTSKVNLLSGSGYIKYFVVHEGPWLLPSPKL